MELLHVGEKGHLSVHPAPQGKPGVQRVEEAPMFGNFPLSDGDVPFLLPQTACCGSLHIIKVLFEQYADVDSTGSTGLCHVRISARHGSSYLVRTLV